jgi:hypothetical protein
MNITNAVGYELVRNGQQVTFSDSRLSMLAARTDGGEPAEYTVRFYDGVCDGAAVLGEQTYTAWLADNAAIVAEYDADAAKIDDLFAGLGG